MIVSNGLLSGLEEDVKVQRCVTFSVEYSTKSQNYWASVDCSNYNLVPMTTHTVLSGYVTRSILKSYHVNMFNLCPSSTIFKSVIIISWVKLIVVKPSYGQPGYSIKMDRYNR
ncbi:hypothetical protein EVAR_47784_1 [Eumeta japonica]|uniref:Uncharacterized protein n=1 Tax=Eumeta variegata TaxID=151549 RepID=A0A4C1XVV7_EUMVA|nr:hypothetical protein EVAR_47784_1 [Eumeta japonica]